MLLLVAPVKVVGYGENHPPGITLDSNGVNNSWVVY